MNHDRAQDLIEADISSLASLYHRLMLVVGPPRSGKTAALRKLSEEQGRPLVNLNLALSEALLEYPPRQRALKAPQLLDEIVDRYSNDVLLLDNTEVLFSPDLQQDPLRLLQRIARNRSIVASWAGEYVGERLTYADPTHPEFRRYERPGALIVSTVEEESRPSPAPQAGTP